MSKEKKLIPELRFPEFNNEGVWDDKRIGEFAPLQRGFDLPVDDIVDGDYPVVFSNGILKYHIEYKVKAPGVVTGRSGTIGKVTYVKEDFWPHNTSLWVTDFFGNFPLFVFYYFVFIRLEQFGTGSGVPTLNRNDVHRHNIRVPISIQEQQKIASCLSSLDELIAAHNDKMDALKDHKKALMQNLFPQEGASVPKYRFPEFEGDGEWVEKKLGDVATFLRGKGISKADIVENGRLPCIRYGELYTYYSETVSAIKSYTNINPDNLVLSQANDVIIPASGETQIDIATASCVLNAGIALGGDLNIIRTELNGVFLAYYLNNAKKTDIAQMAQGVSVIHLYPSQLKTLTIATPKLKEQQKIASCLSALDELITTQGEKIEHLQLHKKGLMQGLFPKIKD